MIELSEAAGATALVLPMEILKPEQVLHRCLSRHIHAGG